MANFGTSTASNVLLALVLLAQVFLAPVLLAMCNKHLCFNTLMITRDKNCEILLHNIDVEGIYGILSRIWKCRESRVLVLIFWAKKAVGATVWLV